MSYSSSYISIDRTRLGQPLFSVPQTLHVKIAFSSPEDASNKSPQSVQNTKDPIADMIEFVAVLRTSMLALSAIYGVSNLLLTRGFEKRSARNMCRSLGRDPLAREPREELQPTKPSLRYPPQATSKSVTCVPSFTVHYRHVF